DACGVFAYASQALVAQDTVPGRTTLWSDFIAKRGDRTDRLIAAAAEQHTFGTGGIGTPNDMRAHLKGFQDAGIDQVIFLQQAGRNRHEDICAALELFAREVMPDCKAEVDARETKKAAELAPFIDAALRRKKRMRPLADQDIPVIRASVERAQVG